MADECKVDETPGDAAAAHARLNDKERLDAEALLTAVDNALIVNAEKGQTIFGGLEHAAYRDCFARRIGEESVFRLAVTFGYDLLTAGISQAHASAEDPAFFHECITVGKMLAYYDRFPRNLTPK
jgi:hypothetical protein